MLNLYPVYTYIHVQTISAHTAWFQTTYMYITEVTKSFSEDQDLVYVQYICRSKSAI